MSYACAGRVYLGDAISAVAVDGGTVTVTGGTELRGIRGQSVTVRLGMLIEVWKAAQEFGTRLVDSTERYPSVLLPFSGARAEDYNLVLKPYRDTGVLLRYPSEGLVSPGPSQNLLVVPDDTSKDFVWVPQAELGPESSDLLYWHEEEPRMNDFVEYVPCGAGANRLVICSLAELDAFLSDPPEE